MKFLINNKKKKKKKKTWPSNIHTPWYSHVKKEGERKEKNRQEETVQSHLHCTPVERKLAFVLWVGHPKYRKLHDTFTPSNWPSCFSSFQVLQYGKIFPVRTSKNVIPEISITQRRSTIGSIVIKSRNLNGPLECILSERNVPEFIIHMSAGTASRTISQIKLPGKITTHIKTIMKQNFKIQPTLVISTWLISNIRLSQSENLVPFTWKSNR